MMYAPQEEQPTQNLAREEMTEVHTNKPGKNITHTVVWNHGNCKCKTFIFRSSWQWEQIIFDHFSDPVFINQFIEFLSLEDRKGKDKFSPRRFCLFKVR